MNENEVVEFGMLAFEGYSFNQNYKTFDGRDIPKWGQLPAKIQESWCVAANVVINEYVAKTMKKIKDMSKEMYKNSAQEHFKSIDIDKLLTEEEK